jgi:calcineurin-like phosphoesterase family protein
MSQEPEKIFVTSDTHFFHENIIKYEERPFQTVEDMNHELIKNWNEVVEPNDLVYFLGDFGMAHPEVLRKILFALNGQISIIRGNHDDSITKLVDIGFSLVADQVRLEYYGYLCVFSHKPELMAPGAGVVNIHGHIHGKIRFREGSINVSTDAWGYKPIELRDLIRQYKRYNARLK